MKVFLGLGSNLGDRETMLRRAVEEIDALPCTVVEAVSSIVETEPVGSWDTCCVRQGDDSDGPDSGDMSARITALPDNAAGSEATQTFSFDEDLQSSYFDEHNPKTRFGKSAAWKDEANKRTNTVKRGRFLNCCVRISTAIPPHRLLEALKGIERKLGRTNEGIRKNEQGQRIYSDRPIDIDILLYGKRRIDRPDLQVPHPRMYERDFVMRPLREIAAKLPEMSQKGGKK